MPDCCRTSPPLDEIEHPTAGQGRTPVRRAQDPARTDPRSRRRDPPQGEGSALAGAVWCEDQSAVKRTWLISAGVREDGSCDDFYAVLGAEAKAARARYNAPTPSAAPTPPPDDPPVPVESWRFPHQIPDGAGSATTQ